MSIFQFNKTAKAKHSPEGKTKPGMPFRFEHEAIVPTLGENGQYFMRGEKNVTFGCLSSSYISHLYISPSKQVGLFTRFTTPLKTIPTRQNFVYKLINVVIFNFNF
jgi:hypothetical protein